MCALENRIYVVDGGFATQLCNHVSDPIDGTPLWSASFLYTNQNAVIKTHLDFLRGRQIYYIYTNLKYESNSFCSVGVVRSNAKLYLLPK
jgi:S-methylmethionine-dependent homocysteine/selenocysteine methylase